MGTTDEKKCVDGLTPHVNTKKNDQLNLTKTYYYGVWSSGRGHGHYVYDRNGKSFDTNTPPGNWIYPLVAPRGYLSPPKHLSDYDRGTDGIAALYTDDAWTIISFYDSSADYRGGQSSLFAVGKFTFEEMLEIFKLQYPVIWNRFNFRLKLGG